MTTTGRDLEAKRKLAIMLEAARQANWDALEGPKHLRSGRYRPTAEDGVEDGIECDDPLPEARSDDLP